MKLSSSQKKQFLGNAVYGALDGTVTTFAVMAGAVGANMSHTAILILGIANLIADGFSMGMGAFLGERSQKDFVLKETRLFQEKVEKNPEWIKKRLTQIYTKKGFDAKNTKILVNEILTNKELCVQELLVDEGISDALPTPELSGLITFSSFVFVGALPVLFFYFIPEILFIHIVAIVSLVLFGVGSLRSRVTSIHWFRGGVEIMAAGVVASLIAFGVGNVLEKMLR
jgi:VIT1/CCC1 family predicted Fe2+/Mn2+ transporter